MQGTRRGRLAEIVGVGALYGALTVWWLWPLPTALRTHSGYFFADFSLVRADFYLTVWVLAWGAHALVTAPWAFFHANAFHPSSLALAYAEHLLGYAPLFAPVYWATGNPILATNVLICLTYPLCGVATFLLVRRFTPAPAAALAGFFNTFYLWRHQEGLAQLQMLGVYAIPLTLLFAERWFARARTRDAVYLGGALFLQAVSAFYLAFALAVVYAAYLPLALGRWRPRLDRRRMVGLALVLGTVALGVVVVSLPYLQLKRLGLIPSYGEGGERTPIGLTPLLAGRGTWEYLLHLGPGPVGYTLAAIALLPPWRWQRGARLTALVIAVAGVVMAFGAGIPVGTRTLWTPYSLLVRWVPGASTIRVPARLVVVAALGFAWLAGLGFARLVSRVHRRIAWPAALAAAGLALVTYGPVPALPLHPEPVGPGVPPAYHWLAEHGAGRPMLEEPPPSDLADAARRMYLSTFHWLPIVDGYSGYPVTTPAYLHLLARDLPRESTLQVLVDVVDLGWILIHRDRLAAPAVEAWNGPLPAGLERVGEWGPDVIVRVTRPVRLDLRSRLLSTHMTLGGAALAALGPQCPGAITLRSTPPAPWVPPSAQVEVEVVNDGDKPWPGFGFIPRHLVGIVACLAPASGPPCAAKPIALGRDLPPGAHVTVTAGVSVPLVPGDYTLSVDLVQRGDGSLARCGVAPLHVPVTVAPWHL